MGRRRCGLRRRSPGELPQRRLGHSHRAVPQHGGRRDAHEPDGAGHARRVPGRPGRRQSLAAHTVNAAWQLFSENEVGSLSPGLFADLIVVDRDPLEATPDELAETEVRATYLAGRRVV
ncbi:amidohydrolase family protein [Microbacterium resistens]|uniref:amidohydrolase family protein n=1 Tax=Microbacterium resistens TaxID=156977 RepID=UPI0022B231BA|nr:amidohydrolase family protein [Microbacterium resistens]